MSFKEKCNLKIENGKATIIISLTVAVCFLAVTIAVTMGINKSSYAMASVEINEFADDMRSKIDIEEILKKNTSGDYHEEYYVEEKDLEYITSYQDNPSLPKGMVQVLQEGRDGSQKVTKKKIIENGEVIKEEIVGSQIIKASIDKIVQVGTGRYTSYYEVKEGDTLYVTADTLGILPEPNQNVERIMTIHKDSEVQLLEDDGEWYKIAYSIYTGYCPANCLTYLKPRTTIDENQGDENELSREQLLDRLYFDMDLTRPSGLSLAQFKQVLSNNEQDENGIFENNYEYFYYIEKQYNVNGLFVAAVGIHESGWGTSSICVDKKNLFGYGAYDRDPYTCAYSYTGYESSIDLIARVFAKYYLNPEGTVIYDGQIAEGDYYNGPTLSGVNCYYATDDNWANAVYYWMTYLYERL